MKSSNCTTRHILAPQLRRPLLRLLRNSKPYSGLAPLAFRSGTMLAGRDCPMKISGVVAIMLLASFALLAQTRGAVSSGGARAATSAPATPRAVGSGYPVGPVASPVFTGAPFTNGGIPGRIGVGQNRIHVPRSSG